MAVVGVEGLDARISVAIGRHYINNIYLCCPVENVHTPHTMAIVVSIRHIKLNESFFIEHKLLKLIFWWKIKIRLFDWTLTNQTIWSGIFVDCV